MPVVQWVISWRTITGCDVRHIVRRAVQQKTLVYIVALEECGNAHTSRLLGTEISFMGKSVTGHPLHPTLTPRYPDLCAQK